MVCLHFICFFFFFNDTATTEIYTLSLHDALPISFVRDSQSKFARQIEKKRVIKGMESISVVAVSLDRKSTRLNSSHQIISYAVFCLKKKHQCERYQGGK